RAAISEKPFSWRIVYMHLLLKSYGFAVPVQGQTQCHEPRPLWVAGLVDKAAGSHMRCDRYGIGRHGTGYRRGQRHAGVAQQLPATAGRIAAIANGLVGQVKATLWRGMDKGEGASRQIQRNQGFVAGLGCVEGRARGRDDTRIGIGPDIATRRRHTAAVRTQVVDHQPARTRNRQVRVQNLETIATTIVCLTAARFAGETQTVTASSIRDVAACLENVQGFKRSTIGRLTNRVRYREANIAGHAVQRDRRLLDQLATASLVDECP